MCNGFYHARTLNTEEERKMSGVTVQRTTYNSRKVAASRRLVNKAAQLLRQRNATTVRTTVATGLGRRNYGLWNGRRRDELKVVDTDITAGPVLAGGSITLLNGVATGTDFTQRIGRKTLWKSIFLRIFFLPTNTVPAPSADVIRVMLIYDSQANGTAPVITDILTVGTYESPMNLNNRDRFRIIADRFVMMGANNYTTGALVAGSPQAKMVQVYKKISLESIYSGTGGTIASIQSGAFYLVVLNASNLSTSAESYVRMRFIDS